MAVWCTTIRACKTNCMFMVYTDTSFQCWWQFDSTTYYLRQLTNNYRVWLGDDKQLKGVTWEYCCSDICAGCTSYSALTKRWKQNDKTQGLSLSSCQVQNTLPKELVAECKLDPILNARQVLQSNIVIELVNRERSTNYCKSWYITKSQS